MPCFAYDVGGWFKKRAKYAYVIKVWPLMYNRMATSGNSVTMVWEFYSKVGKIQLVSAIK